MSKRIVSAAACGAAVAVGSAFVAWLSVAVLEPRTSLAVREVVAMGVWRLFIFGLLSTAGAIVAELSLPDPDLALALKAEGRVSEIAAG